VSFDCLVESSFCLSHFKTKKYPSYFLLNNSTSTENLKTKFKESVELSENYDDMVSDIMTEIKSEIKEGNEANFQSLTYESLHLNKRSPIIYLYSKVLIIRLILLG